MLPLLLLSLLVLGDLARKPRKGMNFNELWRREEERRDQTSEAKEGDMKGWRGEETI